MQTKLRERLVCSPCCVPQWPFEQLVRKYRELGFTKWEAFTEWATARFDWRETKAPILRLMGELGMQVTSFHLPKISAEKLEEDYQNALAAAKFASSLGAKIVLLKASTREVFGLIGKRFLDAVEGEGLVTVVQNHKGTAISTLADYSEVFERVDHDPRLKAVLEVGHFQRAGVSWEAGWDLLQERVALIHLNEMQEGRSVLYGTGEVNFRAVLERVKRENYAGDIVVELELVTREIDPEATFAGLRRAVDHLETLYSKVNNE